MRYAILAAVLLTAPLRADNLADQIRALDPRVLSDDCPWGNPGATIGKDVRALWTPASRRESEKWHALRTKAGWEAVRADRVHALRASLGSEPARSELREIRVTRTHDGEGFAVDNLVFESRGLPVTAN